MVVVADDTAWMRTGDREVARFHFLLLAFAGYEFSPIIGATGVDEITIFIVIAKSFASRDAAFNSIVFPPNLHGFHLVS